MCCSALAGGTVREPLPVQYCTAGVCAYLQAIVPFPCPSALTGSPDQPCTEPGRGGVAATAAAAAAETSSSRAAAAAAGSNSWQSRRSSSTACAAGSTGAQIARRHVRI